MTWVLRYQSGSGGVRAVQYKYIHRPRERVMTSLSTTLPLALTDKTACVLTGNKLQVVSIFVSINLVVSHTYVTYSVQKVDGDN